MAQGSNAEWIVPTTDARSLPVVELLTGRGFVSGKSGSGKSNTVGVIAEELLENGYNFLIVDTEGEYYGLQEEYQLLHVGGDDFADVRVGPGHAEKIAEIGLERNVPVILDVSGFDDVDESQELITRTVEELYRREKQVRKPFLLIVEEMQEYLPQQGSGGDLGEILERVAKRGRKRGLGMCGVSQRPSSVDKDFITQCDWMAWHRLTWEADVKVVSKIIGSDRKDDLTDLDPGEAFLLTDWDDTIERVQFRRKDTHDAGATPGLESYDRPDLKTVGNDLIDEIESAEQSKAEAEATAKQEEPQPENGSLDDLTLPESTPDPDDAAASSGSAGEETDAGESTDSGSGTSEPTEPPGAPIETEPIDVDTDDPEEAVQRLTQRNRVLEREVEELRTLLQSIEPEHERAADHADQPAFATAADGEGSVASDDDRKRAPPAPAPASGAPSTAGSQSAAGTQSSGNTTVASDASDASRESTTPTPTAPSRPMPPERPSNRSGLAGVILEFGEMMIYLLKSTSYRLRLASFKLRRKLS